MAFYGSEYASVRESYTPLPFNPKTSGIAQNISTIQQMQTDLTTSGAKLQKNYSELKSEEEKYKADVNFLRANNVKYHYDDTQDPNILLRPEESNDIKVAIQRDIQDMKLYQNSIYMVSMIAGATLLIATIILVKPLTK
jgi:Skp family chaperone for outer membrane proteins